MPHNPQHIHALQDIQTPAYVLDVAALKRNLAMMAEIKAATDVKILLATKAFSQFSAFKFMQDTLDGTTASGLYEARMGAEHFNGEVHCYSPAYSAEDINDLPRYSGHIYFNSVPQLDRFAPTLRAVNPDIVIGLRVNPRLSLVKNSVLYDPSAPTSRFGIAPEDLAPDVLDKIDLLHFHNLCENMAGDSAALIDHIIDKFGDALAHVHAVNLGGGHFITHENYNSGVLISAIKRLQNFAPHLEIILEPGAAHVLNAGYLVCRVLDIFQNGNIHHAILDTSASTHMPDVLEVPYRPPLMNSGEENEKAHSYILGGRTCMSGDIIGTYSFDQPLKTGDMLVFEDMAQYALVKNTTFNGVPLPDIAILHDDGRYEVVKSFGYGDFIKRLS